MKFYLPENLHYTIFQSMADSVNFTVNRTLTSYKGHRCSKSSFVDVEGKKQAWHSFGDLEGPGWAANAVGGSYEIFSYAKFINNRHLKEIALSVLDHILEDGFINYDTGFITPYREISKDVFCLNFEHNNDWFCSGSMAKIAYQLLVFSDVVTDKIRREKMRGIAIKTAQWIQDNIELAPNGWYARRSTSQGKLYDLKCGSKGEEDPFFDCSGDGLFTLQLMVSLTQRHLADYKDVAREKIELFIKNGGFYASSAHDTSDKDENVSYAVASRVLREAAKLLGDNKIKEFAYADCLEGLSQFEIHEDRNNVETKGLLWMLRNWDTAYLWENAEASLAYLEAYTDTKENTYLQKGLTILRAIAKHHHGEYGFLTEGVDWNNHVEKIHHFEEAEFGDIKYTEPFLNHLHITEPTLYYFKHVARNSETQADKEN